MAVSQYPPPPLSLTRGDPAIEQWLIRVINDIVQSAVTASLTIPGNVLLAQAVADGISSAVSVTSPDATVSSVSVTSTDADTTTTADAPTQGATYNQTDVQDIADLANELKSDYNGAVTLINEMKGDINTLVTDSNTAATLSNELKSDLTQLVTDVNAAITKLNDLLAKQRAAGQLET